MLRLLRRTARWLALPGVVLATSASLVVVNAQPAAAFVPAPAAEKAGSFALKTLAPRAVPFLASGPVGWTIGAGMLAWTAYDTRDYWMPMFQGEPSASDGCNAGMVCDDPSWAATGPGLTTGVRPLDVETARAVYPYGSRVVSVGYADPGSKNTIEIVVRCKSPAQNPNLCAQVGHSVAYRAFSGPDATQPNNPQDFRNPDSTWVICRPSTGGPAKVQRPYGPYASSGGTTQGVAGEGEQKNILITPCGPDLSNDVLGYTNSGGFQTYPQEDYRYGFGGTPGVDFGADPATFDPDAGSENRVTVTCVNGVTGETATLSSTNDASRHGLKAVARIPSCRAELGENWRPQRVQVKHVPGYGKDNPNYVNNLPSFDVSESPDPLWDDCRAAGCQTAVYVDGQKCVRGGAAVCSSWTEVETDRVQCRVGSHVVSLEECDPLADAYKPTAPDRVWAKPRPQPTTPVKSPASAPRPDPEVETSPETGTQPGASPGTNPGTGTTPGGAGAPDPAKDTDGEGAKCWPSGWGMLNPLEWVYRPVRCALVWAFVPTQIGSTMASVATAWNASTPGRWINAWGGFYDDLGDLAGPSGCDGPNWHIKVGSVVDLNVKPLDACTGFRANAAQLVNVLLSIGLYAGAAIVSLRIIASSIGLNLNGYGQKVGD